MNQDKSMVKPRMEMRPPAANPPKAQNGPANGTPSAASPARIEIDPAVLSLSLSRDLKRIPEAEWFRIESIVWRVGFTRDMAEGVRFVDTVANVVNQKAGLFATPNLDRRRKLEEYSQQIVEAFRALIHTTVQVARKINLTNILERYWRLLSIYGPPPKKAGGNGDSAPPEAPKQDIGPVEAA
jgi:hypothetical protein